MQPHHIDALAREAQGSPTTATERWRATVARVLGRDAEGPDGRRQFLKLGGAAVLGAAVLSACGDDEETPPAESGTTEPTTSTTLAPPQGTTPEQGAESDATITRTARSLELALVEVYAVLLGEAEASTDPDALALPGPITYDAEVAEVMEVLGTRHAGHAEALAELVSEAGGDPATEANRGVLEGLLADELPALTTQESVVRFAKSLEDISAATHAWAAGVLTTASLRQGIMAVGAPIARQAALLALVLDDTGMSAVPQPTLDISGPARVPEHLLVLPDQDGGDVSPDPDAAAEGGGEGDEEGEGQGEGEGEAGQDDEQGGTGSP